MKFGAIDIGTNAARLLIGEVVKNDLGFTYVKKVSYTRIPLRLGLDVFDKGKIGPKKKQDFTKTMMAFRLIAEVFGVKNMRACATSAMREAENGMEVQKYIQDKTGVNIEIIDGDEEAHLIFSTFFLLDFEKEKPFVVIDVGGGSTEITIFNKGEITAAYSFKIGTIRLLKNKVKDEEWEHVLAWLKEHLDPQLEYRCFGSGGNINKVHKLFGRAYMQPLKMNEVVQFLEEIEQLSVKQRQKKYNLKPDRADVIVPALTIYTKVMEAIGTKEILVPKIGLSDGIIYDLYNKAKKQK